MFINYPKVFITFVRSKRIAVAFGDQFVMQDKIMFVDIIFMNSTIQRFRVRPRKQGTRHIF